MQRFKRIRGPVAAVWLFLLVGLLGCGSIQLIAPYDQKIDEGVTNLQKMTAQYLTHIERQGGSSAQDYKNQTKFYDDAKVMLSGILVRAQALTDNAKTVQQLEVLDQQFQKLEQDHKTIGISQAAVPQLEKALNRTFTAILTLEVAKKN
ncbi:MAG: hypothetical protein L7F78_23260 [Syntrophales bacterium LBB04]|nr:hypothetical protein [Syntrophales bacterium LBB04]